MSDEPTMRSRTNVRLPNLSVAIVIGLVAIAASPRTPVQTVPRPPLDFSGVWELDATRSVNVTSGMKDAVLFVEQEGNWIRISPAQKKDAPRQALPAEEIVADARPHEKAFGPAGEGLVTAGWARDGKSLWIEVQEGPPEDPRSAVQRSVWKISEDRAIWIRESVSISGGHTGRARLVFRKRSG